MRGRAFAICLKRHVSRCAGAKEGTCSHVPRTPGFRMRWAFFSFKAASSCVMRASSSGFLVRAASRLEIRFSKLLICAGSAADQDYRRTRYLSVGPAWDTVPAANLLQDGGAHAEFLGNVVDGQVKVTREVLEAHALCYGLVGGHGGGGASGATARVSLGQVTFGPKKLAEGKSTARSGRGARSGNTLSNGRALRRMIAGSSPRRELRLPLRRASATRLRIVRCGKSA